MTLPTRFLLAPPAERILVLLALIAFWANHAFSSPVSPPPAPLTIYAIWEGINNPLSDETAIASQMNNLLNQFGHGNQWHHPGFAFIFRDQAHTEMIARIAREKRVSLGIIFAVQTHTRPGPDYVFLDRDLRSYQWRMNTRRWEGYFTSHNKSGGLEIPCDARDSRVPSPSRYSPLGEQLFSTQILEQARAVRRIMDQYPGVISCINGVIEEELAVGAAAAKKYPEASEYLGDYSPWAVTEFRDWLLHRGFYEDGHGKYAGQGAPEAITGSYVVSDGIRRSPFYADLAPDRHAGPGESFNQRFGTQFRTWSLKYWDTLLFPKPITTPDFDPMPDPGKQGFTDGGFDAPRKPDRSAWWRAWSWDYQDEGKRYPGNPPAFGFRQCEVAHFVQDRFDDLAAAGLPRDIMYAHQIPGEQVSAERCRSSASPVWTGYLPASQTVGVTCFGWFDPALATQYLPPCNHGWGIFEWHARPNAGPDDQKLYDSAMKAMLVFSRENCRHLFAGWWRAKSADAKIFPLNDSKFAEAIKAFMDSTPENPPPMPASGVGDKKIR